MSTATLQRPSSTCAPALPDFPDGFLDNLSVACVDKALARSSLYHFIKIFWVIFFQAGKEFFILRFGALC